MGNSQNISSRRPFSYLEGDENLIAKLSSAIKVQATLKGYLVRKHFNYKYVQIKLKSDL